MRQDPYSERVRALFSDPVHAGGLDDASHVAVHEQGVHVQLFAHADHGALRSLRFQAWGCPHFIAAAEAFCVEFEGRPVADLQAFTATELMQSLPVPVQKTGRILVIEDAVRSLGQRLRGTSNADEED